MPFVQIIPIYRYMGRSICWCMYIHSYIEINSIKEKAVYKKTRQRRKSSDEEDHRIPLDSNLDNELDAILFG